MPTAARSAVTHRRFGLLRWAHRVLPAAVRARVRPLLSRLGVAAPAAPDNEHPERLAVLEHVPPGLILEVGCGPRKTTDAFVGVDLTPGGVAGLVGNAAGRTSQADVAADGGNLPFATGSFSGLVARHNLEHYVDPIAALREWERVVRPGGRVVLVVPDEDAYMGRTLDLDPTHFHAFNESFARSLLRLLGWDVERIEPCVAGWSLLVVAHTPV